MSFMSSCITMAASSCHVCPQSNHVKDIWNGTQLHTGNCLILEPYTQTT